MHTHPQVGFFCFCFFVFACHAGRSKKNKNEMPQKASVQIYLSWTLGCGCRFLFFFLLTSLGGLETPTTAVDMMPFSYIVRFLLELLSVLEEG